MRDDFSVFKEYYLQTINQIPEDSFYRQTIHHKFKHSIEVLHVGQTILKHTPELRHQTEDFIATAEKALLFHDVGRFEENLRRYKASVKNNEPLSYTKSSYYDHCVLGYNILKNNPLYNDPKILYAVRFHGKRIENMRTSASWKKIEQLPEKDIIKNILFLVRDADKLANLHHIKIDNHLTKDLFYKQLTPEALHAPISATVKKQFMAGKTILSSTVYSFADRLMQVLSWIFDLNFQTSQKIFKKEKYVDFLIQQLAQYHPYSDDINTIKKRIKQV